jgi:hypothetical protein
MVVNDVVIEINKIKVEATQLREDDEPVVTVTGKRPTVKEVLFLIQVAYMLGRDTAE